MGQSKNKRIKESRNCHNLSQNPYAVILKLKLTLRKLESLATSKKKSSKLESDL